MMNNSFKSAALAASLVTVASVYAAETPQPVNAQSDEEKTVCLQFSQKARMLGSGIVKITDAKTGAVKEVEYTNWFGGQCSDPRNEYEWEDKVTVYEGPAKNAEWYRKGVPYERGY